MGSITNDLELDLLDHVLETAAYVPASTLYMSLHTVDPGETGSVANEVSGNGYARTAIAFSAAASRQVIQNGQVTFPQVITAPWGTITHFGIHTASTGAGNMIGYGAFDNSIVTEVGNVPFVPDLETVISVNSGGASDYLALALLDFAFRCPVELKLDNKIFLKSAMKIYGPGARIKCVNDGVRPGSSHISRLAQRAISKTQNRIIQLFEKLGKTSKSQHSWSDYQKYWSQSSKLKSFINEYGANLDQFDGCLFSKCGKDLLKSENIHWRNGYRLLQVAVWKGIVEDYQKQLKKITEELSR